MNGERMIGYGIFARMVNKQHLAGARAIDARWPDQRGSEWRNITALALTCRRVYAAVQYELSRSVTIQRPEDIAMIAAIRDRIGLGHVR